MTAPALRLEYSFAEYVRLVHRTTESATLEAIGCTIDVDDLYRDPLE